MDFYFFCRVLFVHLASLLKIIEILYFIWIPRDYRLWADMLVCFIFFSLSPQRRPAFSSSVGIGLSPRLLPRVENGTGKSRPDRLRLPSKPTVNRFGGKNRKMGKQNGKMGGNGNENGWGVFPTVFTVPIFSRENSRGNSRICRSRLCYLCWKCELLFACVTTWIVNSWFTLPVFLNYTSLVFMLFMHSCNYFVELNVWSGCIYFPVLSYRFPIVIGMLPTDWFRSRYPVIPISFSRPTFPFPLPFPTKKYSCGNG